jgi:predicted metal-dependent phosphoesterase TrpH
MDVTTTPEDGTTHQGRGEIHAGWVLQGLAIQDVWMIPRLRDRQPRIEPLPGAGNWYGTTLRIYVRQASSWEYGRFATASPARADNTVVLKTELHAHTDLDPKDRIPHSTVQLIDRAAALGYQIIAVTLHERYFDPESYRPYARERGLVLLSGIERTIAGRHVLLINFGPECASVQTFDDVERLKARASGLVIAPHPFYPTISSLRDRLEPHAAVFDAVELSFMYTRHIDFNRRAVAFAKAHQKPLVGNTDLHRLDQLGTTYSLVDADPEPDAICGAIRAGRVEVRTEPISLRRAATTITRMATGGVRGRVRLGRTGQTSATESFC